MALPVGRDSAFPISESNGRVTVSSWHASIRKPLFLNDSSATQCDSEKQPVRCADTCGTLLGRRTLYGFGPICRVTVRPMTVRATDCLGRSTGTRTREAGPSIFRAAGRARPDRRPADLRGLCEPDGDRTSLPTGMAWRAPEQCATQLSSGNEPTRTLRMLRAETGRSRPAARRRAVAVHGRDPKRWQERRRG